MGWIIFPAAILLALSLWTVLTEIAALKVLAGGMAPLDVQFGYDQSAIIAFADQLGPEGRQAYAMFQLGADTLAPPAFACFLMAVFRSTVRSNVTLSILSGLTAVYFVSVLLANTFMPVIMQNYPDRSSGILNLLYTLIPILDLLKYCAHGLAWLIILTAWIRQIARWNRKRQTSSRHQKLRIT